jgi:hypothetical protein
VPVLGVRHRAAGGEDSADLGVDDGNDVGTTRDRQPSPGVGKVVLDIDDDEGRP